jgi:hypothetical protein
VDDFGAIFEVEASVVAMEAWARRDVTAAQEIGGLVELI